MVENQRQDRPRRAATHRPLTRLNRLSLIRTLNIAATRKMVNFDVMQHQRARPLVGTALRAATVRSMFITTLATPARHRLVGIGIEVVVVDVRAPGHGSILVAVIAIITAGNHGVAHVARVALFGAIARSPLRHRNHQARDRRTATGEMLGLVRMAGIVMVDMVVVVN